MWFDLNFSILQQIECVFYRVNVPNHKIHCQKDIYRLIQYFMNLSQDITGDSFCGGKGRKENEEG
jgi:hypothetical protein